MPKLTFTNVRGKGPRGINRLSGGVTLVDRGESKEVEVSDGELAGLGAYFDFDHTPAAPELAPEEERKALILAAVEGLDPENDEHWTNAGLPAVDAVKAILGDEITRAELNEMAPNFMRPAV